MARSKNYLANAARSDQVALSQSSTHSTDDAFIDLVKLAGPEARFPGNKSVDLRRWLGLGIDPWVHACASCLRTLILSGARTTATVCSYGSCLRYLFGYLLRPADTLTPQSPLTPSELQPLHVQHFIGWLKKLAQDEAWRPASSYGAYKAVKAVLVEMFTQGFIPADSSRYFPRAAVSWRNQESLHVSFSDAEQERIAKAIRSDLIAQHHGRLSLKGSDVQGLRLLVVAHRQGLNITPLLEMRRDAIAPGFLPGTIRIRTAKLRSKTARSSSGRSAQSANAANASPIEEDLFFDLSEGAILQQAISASRDLVEDAPVELRRRIWLYRSPVNLGKIRKGDVACLTRTALEGIIVKFVERHALLGDDGLTLRLNFSRLRKSRFDRAIRVSDGDIAITANLMGNTPRVAAQHYPSMNDARKAEAAAFMNQDYISSMRLTQEQPEQVQGQLIQVHPIKQAQHDGSRTSSTPISGCLDLAGGQHAPNDGRSHCDRYVMCLFCASFAIVGTVDELWRLYSFQKFAIAELDYLDKSLGLDRSNDLFLEDLRDRYRVVIPYIDEFTVRQFARSRVTQARAKTSDNLHPYWEHQMTVSRRAQSRGLDVVAVENEPQKLT